MRPAAKPPAQEMRRSDRSNRRAADGGSAGDAQHLATELTCRYKVNRRALPAIAFTTDTSLLTAAANDFGYETIFARQVEALCKPGDVVSSPAVHLLR